MFKRTCFSRAPADCFPRPPNLTCSFVASRRRPSPCLQRQPRAMDRRAGRRRRSRTTRTTGRDLPTHANVCRRMQAAFVPRPFCARFMTVVFGRGARGRAPLGAAPGRQESLGHRLLVRSLRPSRTTRLARTRGARRQGTSETPSPHHRLLSRWKRCVPSRRVRLCRSRGGHTRPGSAGIFRMVQPVRPARAARELPVVAVVAGTLTRASIYGALNACFRVKTTCRSSR